MAIEHLLRYSEQPAPPVLVRAAGFVMSAFGVVLASVDAWYLYRLWLLDRLDRPIGLAFVVVAGTIAFFCLTVGGRMYLNRPNRYGSLLTPRGWAGLGAVFQVVAALVALIGIVSGMYVLLLGCVLTVALGLMCLRTGSRLSPSAGSGR